VESDLSHTGTVQRLPQKASKGFDISYNPVFRKAHQQLIDRLIRSLDSFEFPLRFLAERD